MNLDLDLPLQLQCRWMIEPSERQATLNSNSVTSEQEAREIFEAARRLAPFEVGGTQVQEEANLSQDRHDTGPAHSTAGTEFVAQLTQDFSGDQESDDGLWREQQPGRSIRNRFRALQRTLDEYRSNGLLK